ncbi:MAG: DUF6204 family protein [Thermomicrobiales bacterium]
METRRYRTIARGRFAALDEAQKASLRADAAAHDALKAQFTEEGTFTYDRALAFFAFRHEFAVTAESAAACDAEAPVVGEVKALQDLERLGLAARDDTLTVSVSCLSDMRTERRKGPKRRASTAGESMP